MKILILLCGLSLSGSLLASDAVDPLTIEFYSISGDTTREVGSALDEHGPVGSDGVRYHGYTQWQINWSYRFSPKGRGCELQSFDTDLKVVMTLPKWDRPERASNRLVAQWEQYSTALRVHEDGHYEIAVAAAEEIKRRISGQQSTIGCASFGKHLDKAASVVVEEFRKIEREYDRETMHGATQGARFPSVKQPAKN